MGKYQCSNEHRSRVEALQDLFAERHRFSKDLIERTQSLFGPKWTADFNNVMTALFSDEESLALAAKGYSAFALNSMRLQKAFEITQEYPIKSYAAAAKEVYFNEAYMEQKYLPGLLLSHFLWPHHYQQLQFFDAAFLDPISRSEFAEFAEIGIGTALYSRRILENVPEAVGVGYDISPSSCRYAERHVSSVGALARYEVSCQDILEKPIKPVSWLVCVEVLEHLENPLEFLVALRIALRPNGKAFITAAVNAAHADHIYLYRDAQQVEHQLQEAGFVVEQAFSARAFAPPASGVAVPEAAAFVVYPA